MSTNKKRTVLITGGTGSVGLAIIRAVSVIGHSVTFQFHFNEKKAKWISKKFNASAIKLDLQTNPFLPVPEFDILINNAGINLSDHSTMDCTDEEIAKTLAVNLLAPFYLSKQVLPYMKSKRWGRIINISSIYGLKATEGNCPYTISKHGLSGLTKTVAKEYAEFGITCNEICPGPIYGKLMRRIAMRSFKPDYASPSEYLRAVEKEIPAKRFAEPDEIAALAVFLSSKDSGYINGVSIPIDGGLLA